jgi:carboxyl-terminal processing protease
MAKSRFLLQLSLVILWLAVAFAPLHAAAESDLEYLKQQASQFEKSGQWDNACEAYDRILSLSHDRSRADVRDHYLSCLKHAQLAHRCRDVTFRDVLSKDFSFTLKVYGEVLAKLRANYVQRDRVSLTQLFRYGLDELRLALSDEAFRKENLAGVAADKITAFQNTVQQKWANQAVETLREAQASAAQVALAAQEAIGLRPALSVMELACGACSGLDEFTLLLTPGQFEEEYAALAGETLGVGIDLTDVNRKIVISQVLPGSPAANAGLKAGDSIGRINLKRLDDADAVEATECLRGPTGSEVELEIADGINAETHTIRLTRQPIVISSVLRVHVLRDQNEIGYCQLSGFQASTAQELDEALMLLKSQGMRALILDLRGNPGGMFQSAIQVCERFLPDGIIVSTQSQVRDQNRTYRANNPAAFQFPLVLLIDGDTASAAEIVAGAFKERGRATLVGQPTFGKGCIQRVLQLESVPAGIRVTMAQFFSPRGQAYTGNGVTPHILIERSLLTMADPQLEVAIQEASRLLILQR